jgi:hypothetical protein
VDESASFTSLERPQWTPDGGIVYTYHGFVVEGGSVKGESFRAERMDPPTGQRTVLASDAEGATLAADGNLAFVRTTRAGQQLVLVDSSGAERVLIADRTFVSLAAPRFSPDGKRIAFTAVGEGPKAGSRWPSRAMPDAAHIRFPPTLGSEHLAWLTGALAPGVAYAHGEPAYVWVVELNGDIRRMGTLREDEPTVAWHEGGQHLAVSGGTGVYVIDVTTGSATKVSAVGGFGGIDWTR